MKISQINLNAIYSNGNDDETLVELIDTKSIIFTVTNIERICYYYAENNLHVMRFFYLTKWYKYYKVENIWRRRKLDNKFVMPDLSPLSS